MKLIRTTCLTLTTGLLLAGKLSSQDAAARLRVLDRDLPAIMDSAGVPGLMLVVFENGRVAATRSYGVRSSATMGSRRQRDSVRGDVAHQAGGGLHRDATGGPG